MRKDAKKVTTVSTASIQGYHGGAGNSLNYAFNGFSANKYFTSDRFINLDANFRRPDNKPLKGYGLEIETECNGVRNPAVLAELFDKLIFSQFPADLFKMQRDGSLGGDTSAECITQVMTREFIRNNYCNFKSMYDTYFPAFNIGAGSSDCGMHVNISRACFGAAEKTQADAVRKLYYIVNHYFDFCCELFRRDRRATHYCAKMPADKTFCKSMNLGNRYSDHGVSFNLGHWNEGRIEIRLVAGQKNFPAFRNTMECIFHLVEAVKSLSWAECDDLTKIFAGCNQYVFDRIKSYCYQANTISAEQVEAIRATVKRVELI